MSGQVKIGVWVLAKPLHICYICSRQVSILQIYSEMIRNNLPKVLRLKIVALVTVEVHARDVIEKLLKAGCNDINAFEWLCQLRHYYENKVKSTVWDLELYDLYKLL